MHDIQPHLSVNSEQGLLAHHLLTFVLSIPIITISNTWMVTHEGNRPLHRATYSFRTVPAMNSLVSCVAREAEVGMIMRPEVRRSRRFTAVVERIEGM